MISGKAVSNPTTCSTSSLHGIATVPVAVMEATTHRALGLCFLKSAHASSGCYCPAQVSLSVYTARSSGFSPFVFIAASMACEKSVPPP